MSRPLIGDHKHIYDNWMSVYASAFKLFSQLEFGSSGRIFLDSFNYIFTHQIDFSQFPKICFAIAMKFQRQIVEFISLIRTGKNVRFENGNHESTYGGICPAQKLFKQKLWQKNLLRSSVNYIRSFSLRFVLNQIIGYRIDETMKPKESNKTLENSNHQLEHRAGHFSSCSHLFIYM